MIFTHKIPLLIS